MFFSLNILLPDFVKKNHAISLNFFLYTVLKHVFGIRNRLLQYKLARQKFKRMYVSLKFGFDRIFKYDSYTKSITF